MNDAAWKTEHVGSLVRPPELTALRMAMFGGRIDPDDLRRTEDSAILAALERQERIGLDLVGDGEFRRFSFMGEFTAAVGGFAPAELPNPDWFTDQGTVNPGARAFVAVSPMTVKRRLAAEESAFLKKHASRPFKITLPSPLVVAQAGWKKGLSDGAYPRRADMMWAAAGILHGEIASLAAEGVPCIQLDNPGLAYYLDPDLRARSKAAGIEVDIPLEEALAADDHCVEGARESGAAVSMHFCRGNWRSAWLAKGGLEPVAEAMFAQPRVDRFLLEFDTQRAGGFEPLRFVPEGKTVVLGLLSSKHGRLEETDVLLRRIDEAARFVPLERLALSPQCGFATSIPGNTITGEEQWAKMELVVATARRAWGSGQRPSSRT